MVINNIERTAYRTTLMLTIGITTVFAVYLFAIRHEAFFNNSFTLIFQHLLANQDALTVWLSVFISLIAAARIDVSRLSQGVTFLSARPALTAATCAVACGLLTLTVYRNFPLSMDEYAAVFQAKIFSHGVVTGLFPVDLIDWLVPDKFNHYFFMASAETGQVLEKYWPGFSLLLTPFEFFGIPWACNSCLAGLSLYLIYRITYTITGSQRSAGLAMFFCIGSSAFIANAISYYSMQAHMTASLVYVWLLMVPTRTKALCAGLVGSLALILHNPLRHTLIAVPWLIGLLIDPKQRRYAPWIAMGYLPFAVGIGVPWFIFNSGTTFNSNAVSTVSRASGLVNAFVAPSAATLSMRLASLSKLWVWAIPGLVVWAAIGLHRYRGHPVVVKLGLSVAITFLGYLCVPFDQGHGWGHRQFHAAWGFLPILAGCAMAHRESISNRLTSYALCATALSLLILVPAQLYLMSSFINKQMHQVPEPVTLGCTVQFINMDTGFYPEDLIRNDPFLHDHTITMVDKGTTANATLVRTRWPNAVLTKHGTWGEQWTIPDCTTIDATLSTSSTQ
jgi:hypothetical protein